MLVPLPLVGPVWYTGADEFHVAADAPAVHVDDGTVRFRRLTDLVARQKRRTVIRNGDPLRQQDLHRGAQAFGHQLDVLVRKNSIAQVQLQLPERNLQLNQPARQGGQRCGACFRTRW
jgi:hypothetical protein